MTTTAIAVLTNGNMFTGTDEGHLVTWGALSPESSPSRVDVLLGSGIRDIAELSDGRLAVAYYRSDNPDHMGVALYNCDTNELAVVPGLSASCLLPLSNGDMVVANGDVCSLYSNERKAELDLDGCYVNDMVALPGDKVIAITTDSAVYLWDIQSGTAEHLFDADEDNLVKVVPVDGDLVAVWTDDEPRLERWSMETKQIVSRTELDMPYMLDHNMMDAVKVTDALVVMSTDGDTMLTWEPLTNAVGEVSVVGMRRLVPSKDGRVWCMMVDDRVVCVKTE